MNLEFTVTRKIHRPINEVYKALVDSNILNQYYTSRIEGEWIPDQKVTLFFGENFNLTIKVIEVCKDEKVVFEWEGSKVSYQIRVKFQFEKLSEKSTRVKVSENGWKMDQESLNGSYIECAGWQAMLDSMKSLLEHGNPL